jgi:ACS family hexuronate transporter-like MFS transporter
MKIRSTYPVILGFLFVATGLSFLDRQVLPVTIIKIQEDFHITDIQYGIINTSFLISYAIMFTVSGRIMDMIGGRKGLAVSLGIWSLASCLHGTMSGFIQLLSYRFLLGAGEGGCFPGAAKIVHDYFDKSKRAFANGIAIGGSALGAVAAPPLVIWVSNQYGWRWSFLVPGIIGILWLAGWLSLPWKRIETRHTEKKAVREVIPLLKIITNKAALIFILMRFLLDPVMYFIMSWVPKFLHETRGISFDEIGRLFWIPFLGLGIANIAGGWCSDLLIKKGFSLNASRKWMMGIAAAITVVAPFIAWATSVYLIIALVTLLLVAHGFWITNYITAISDVFGKDTASIVGLSGTAGAVAGMIANPLIGYWVQAYSYTSLWVITGAMYPLAFILFARFIPDIKPVRI